MSSNEEDDSVDDIVNEVVAVFTNMDKEERQEVLSELLSRYCPECGDAHASCACENDEISGPADELDLGDDELSEEESDETLEGEL